jgi:hypothetical protein
MPISRYNRAFGGKAGSAAKAHRSMMKTYGSRGESVFYATAMSRVGKAQRKAWAKRARRG